MDQDKESGTLVSVTFIASSSPYHPPDIAGFPPKEAEAFVKAGKAVYTPKAEDESDQAAAEAQAAQRAEIERRAAEQAEAERQAAEQAQAAQRLALAEADRVAAEQAEAERVAAEQAEAERVAAEKAAGVSSGKKKG